MCLVRRWTVVFAGFLLAGLGCVAAVAQEAVPAPTWSSGPVVMPAGGQSMPGVVVQSGGDPFSSPPGGNPYAAAGGPGYHPGPPGRPEIHKRPDGEKKPDSEKPENKEDEKKEEKKDGESKEEKKDGAGPTRRPTEPPEPPDPEVLKVRPDEQGKVRFNFKGHSWPSVLEWIADISGMSLDWQELPEGYLNLITQKSYTVAEARDLINRHLLARGYTMLIQDEVISVSKVDSINTAVVPRVEPEQLPECLPYEFVKTSFQLDWLLAPDAVEELKPMLSPNGKLTALTATNRVEAMDAAINLQQIYRVLQEEQSDSGQDRLVREFPLKHTSAKEVVEHLNTLLGIESKNGAPKGPMTPQQMEAMKRQAQMQAEMAKNAGKGGPAPKAKADIYLLANERQNSVIVNAPPDKMAVISQAIEILDVSSAPRESIVDSINRVQVYRLENVEPEAVVKMIEEMGSLDHTTRLEVDDENNAIIASATLVDHVTIRTLIDRLDQGGRKSVILPLENLRAEMVVKQIDFLMGGAEQAEKDAQSSSGGMSRGFNPFESFGRSFSRSRGGQQAGREDKFRVSADVKNNALILWCNEFELRKVEGLLEQLESMPDSGDGVFQVQVYRLNTLDPEPLVATLEDMDALGVHASLKADKESKSIVAYATAPDHKKIQELIDRLDSSGRKFEVVQLRRLQADYVAGTVEFMMDAGEKEQQTGSRYYWDYYSRGRDQEKEESGFKVDADVENNRLLLLANEAEMEEVMNLLVKLGEIPAEGGDPSKVRVIDSLPGPELEKLLKQIEKAWPSMAPNPLVVPDTEAKDKAAERAPGGETTDRQTGTQPTTSSESPFRFAQHETSGEESTPAEETTPPVSEKPAETPAETAGETAVATPGTKGDEKETPSGEETKDKMVGKAPVSISVGPDGRLVIASEDTKALDQLEELMTTLMPERPDYHVFQLKYAYASTVAYNLEDIFEDKEEDSGRGRSFFFYDYYGSRNNQQEDKLRLSKRRPLKFISDYSSNSILVQNADPGQLKVVADLIEFYDQPEPSDSQSVRKTEVVSVKYSKASLIAETVKDVYRDLLSSNDKALANNQQRNAPPRNYTYVFGDSSDEERKTPSFKGLLSLGVDDLSNTLIVSAPAYFIEDVLKVIEELDQAAEPTVETVEVISLSQGVSALEIQEKLMKILQQRSSGGNRENRPSNNQPHQPGPFPGGGPPHR